MAKDKGSKGGSAKVIDFSGVKDRGAFNPKHVQEGDYAAIVTKVEDGETKGDQEFQYVFTIKLEKYSQNSYPYRCKLQENQLWKIRNLLIAAGINVPKSRQKVDPNRVVGKKIGVTMEDHEYEGKMSSQVGAVFPVSELADGASSGSGSDDDDFEEGTPQVAGDEDEAPKKPKKKDKGKKGKKGKDVEDIDISDV